MQEHSSATLEKIQQAALDEFLEKGFHAASLRQIVKHAGVTTGAFYGYFSSKEALFASIVEPHAAALMGKFMEAQLSFAELPEDEQPEHMGVESGSCIHWMVEYICQHREPVKLLLCRAEGTSYEHFVHNMVEVRWSIPCNICRCCAAWEGTSRRWTVHCATSSPAGCSTASSRWWFTTFPANRPCGMWTACAPFIRRGGSS